MRIRAEANQYKGETKISKTPKRQSFGAFQAATIKSKINGIKSDMIIYEIEPSDSEFLHRMLKTVLRCLKDLSPNTPPNHLKMWKEEIEECVHAAKHAPTCLITSKNRPCGIVSLMDLDKKKELFVSDVATWPIRTAESVKLCGKGIFRHIFQLLKEKKYDKVELFPLKKGRGNPLDFYKSINFSRVDKEGNYGLKGKNLKTTIESLDSVLKYKRISDKKHVDLSEILNLNYEIIFEPAPVKKPSFSFSAILKDILRSSNEY